MLLSIFDSALTYAPLVAGVAAIVFVYLKHRTGTCEIRIMRKLALALAGFLACVVAAKIAVHYFVLAGDPSFGALLLPPHQPWDWFLRMAISRYVFPYALSLAVAGLAFLIEPLVNKLFKGELFAEEDKYIVALAALIVGWPNFVMYLGAAVILTILLSIRETLRYGIEARIVLTDALIFSVPLVLALDPIIAPYLYLYKLTIFA